MASPNEKAHVPQALFHLRDVVDSVAKQTEHLNERLGPVMHGPETLESDKSSERPSRAVLADELRSLCDVLMRVDETLRQIHSNLQI